MPFPSETKDEINKYVFGHLPNEDWYNDNFYPFIKDTMLRKRLIVEYKNCRVIYKILQGLKVDNELLLAQIKTQLIMYVSIQEAVVNYVLFDLLFKKEPVQDLLFQDRFIQISIPENKLKIFKDELNHDGKKIYTCYKEKKEVDKTKIRYDQKINACSKLKLIDDSLKDDLINLYEYRNTIHLEAELKKNLPYNLEIGQLAYWRIEGLSIQLKDNLKNLYDI